jgi:hypothetical protein
VTPDTVTAGRLRDYLVESRIAGDVATTREDNLTKYAMFAKRVPQAMFGLSPRGRWDRTAVLELMARVVGVDPDPGHVRGADRIDPDLTIAALDRLAERVGSVARPGARVLVATGHPAGLLPVHLAVARALSRAGTELLRPGAGWSYDTFTRSGPSSREIRYVEHVAMVSNRGELNHSHSARPVRAALDALDQSGATPPDLVIGDHGWAGGAGAAGVAAVGFADSNDPALFVGEEEGDVAVSVPLDDNVAPHLYEPLTAYLLARAGLA